VFFLKQLTKERRRRIRQTLAFIVFASLSLTLFPSLNGATIATMQSFYNQLEGAVDGVIELRVMERDQEWKNLLCIRSLKGQPHDARWHEIEIKPNGEAALALAS